MTEASNAIDWRENQLLAGLSQKTVDAVGILLRERKLVRGDVLTNEGDAADRMFLLISGHVEIFSGGESFKIAEVHPGSYFGEMGLFNNEERSTSVIAAEDVTVMELTAADLQQHEKDTGQHLIGEFAKNHCQTLDRRLRDTNETTVQSMRSQLESLGKQVAFGSFFFTIIVLIFVYSSSLSLIKDFVKDSASSTWASSAMLFLMVGAFSFFIKRSPFPLSTYGLTLHNWKWVTKDALIWSGLVIAIATVAKLFLILFVAGYEDFTVYDPWVSPAGMTATIGAYALYIALSPAQEFVGRGVLQGVLGEMLVGRHAGLRAILLSNAIFSIAHQHLGVAYALGAFIPGLFWGWMYLRHGSLLGVSISHIVIGLWLTGVISLPALFG